MLRIQGGHRGFPDSCEMPRECWELTTGALEEQPLLSSQSHLSSPNFYLLLPFKSRKSKESDIALLRGKGTGRFRVAHFHSWSPEDGDSSNGHLFLGTVARRVSCNLDQVISLQHHSQELSYNLQWDKEFFSYGPVFLGPGKEPIKFLPQIMPKDNLKIQGYKSYNRGHWLNHPVIKIHSLPVLKDNPENKDVVKDKAMQADINHPYSCTASHDTSASVPSPAFSFQFGPKLLI